MTDITPQLSLWIQQLRAIAQTGLAFDPHVYDRERYEALLTLAATMAATVNSNAALDAELAAALAARWRAELPQPTYRKRPDWIDHAWAIHHGKTADAYFDRT